MNKCLFKLENLRQRNPMSQKHLETEARIKKLKKRHLNFSPS